MLENPVLILMNSNFFKINLDLNNYIGISINDYSGMASKVSGALEPMLDKILNAIKWLCLNHNLNLAISKFYQIQSIRNNFGEFKKIISLFQGCLKQNWTQQLVLYSLLNSLYEIMWVERHTAVIQYSFVILETMDTK